MMVYIITFEFNEEKRWEDEDSNRSILSVHKYFDKAIEALWVHTKMKEDKSIITDSIINTSRYTYKNSDYTYKIFIRDLED